MINFTGGLKVYLALDAQDMRKSFNGLAALVSDHLALQPHRGALYVFTNRHHTRIKLLYWDGTGLWGAAKRLEEGTFSWPKPAREGERKICLTPEALGLLTDGIDLRGAQLREWYRDGE